MPAVRRAGRPPSPGMFPGRSIASAKRNACVAAFRSFNFERIFPDPPLFFLPAKIKTAGLSFLVIGVTYFIASSFGYGAGDVRAVTYEYGNAFLIVAGLLNMLVVIDAYDVAMGRK